MKAFIGRYMKWFVHPLTAFLLGIATWPLSYELTVLVILCYGLIGILLIPCIVEAELKRKGY